MDPHRGLSLRGDATNALPLLEPEPDLYYQKLELLTYIFAGDSMGLCLLLLTQLFLKVKRYEPGSDDRKRILT